MSPPCIFPSIPGPTSKFRFQMNPCVRATEGQLPATDVHSGAAEELYLRLMQQYSSAVEVDDSR
jgi:hypothetical protein